MRRSRAARREPTEGSEPADSRHPPRQACSSHVLRLALDRANPVIISNPTVSKAKAAADKYKLPKYSSDAMDVINDPDVEAVWICSPSNVHADQIKACAAAGKHVFCEKPVGVDILQTIEAINACNDAGVKLMTALQRRFDPNFARIKTALDNG